MDNKIELTEKLKLQMENEIKESPFVVCQCGSNKWEMLYIVKYVPSHLSKTRLLELPILCCKICRRELPTSDKLSELNNIEEKGELNNGSNPTNESKNGPSRSTENDI